MRFVFLVLLQVLILNNAQISSYINPFLYIYFIVVLPLETPRSALLFLGFALGISIDIFTQTLGMHAAATIFLAYCRPYVLKIMSPREEYEFGTLPGIADMGLVWFISYAGALTFLHHLILFLIEVFRFDMLHHTMGKTLLSSIFTLVLMILAQFLFYRKRRTA